MKKFLLLLVLFLAARGVIAQQKGISYQAVLINAKNISAPGQDVYNAPLTNKNICILFTVLDAAANTEYQEYQTTTTDAFGMVNLVIGTGTKSGGYASLLSTVNWGLGNKTLVVAINALGNCSDYTEISREKLNYVPYAFFAENATVADGAITTAKLADGAVTDIKVAPGINKSKVGLGNVDNTSDANKPISTATQTALNLKEDIANKSNTIIADAASVTKYPSVKAIKDYVDSKSVNLQPELDATQIGAGLAANGNYIANASSNYIKTATSLADADNKLDAQMKGNVDALQLNLHEKLDKVLTKAETIATTNANTLSITGLQDIDLNTTADQTLTINPTTGLIAKTSSLTVFKEYVKDIIANDGQTQFTTSLPIVDISKVNVYRNGIRINLIKVDANTIALESGVICYQNDEIKIVQFN